MVQIHMDADYPYFGANTWLGAEQQGLVEYQVTFSKHRLNRLFYLLLNSILARNHDILNNILQDAKKAYQDAQGSSITIYVSDS